MGRRGPPKKPAALKKAQGTYQPCRDAAPGTVDAAAGIPPMPNKLKGVARRRWNEVAPELHRMGTLAIIDGGALEAYCRAFGRWSKLEDMAQDSPVGDAATEARKLHKEVIQPLEVALGLHYAARSRVKAPDAGKKNEEEEDIFGTSAGGPPPLTALPGGKPA